MAARPRKRKLTASTAGEALKGRPRQKRRKISHERSVKAANKKKAALQDFKKLHMKVIGELLSDQRGYDFELVEDNMMRLRVQRDGRIFDMDFEKRTIRPNPQSPDRKWAAIFTKQSQTSKRGICIAEFSHGPAFSLKIKDKESLKLFYLNVIEHVIDVALFNGRRPVGIKKAKWEEINETAA